MLGVRGTGRWLGADATDVISAMFGAARIGRPDGLNMIELRHNDSQATGVDGALTRVPAPFLLRAVGAAVDGDARSRIDRALGEVEIAGRTADIGRAATSFREGQLMWPMHGHRPIWRDCASSDPHWIQMVP
ncbi:MAG: hypothetical protein QOD58_2829 [Mycobacterium sp.]|jgi:hypothetical protein|nr:hypothetical protein [Mycobacterium sp.]